MGCGIYKISTTTNDKFYIGSALDIDNRIEKHFELLRKDKHYNWKLQQSFNEFGEDIFNISTIELVNISNLNKKETKKHLLLVEQQYLNTLLNANIKDSSFFKLGYNLSRTTGGGDTGNPAIGEKHSKHIKISVFDLDMNFVEEVCGLRATERKYNSYGIKRCCQGKSYSCKGFIFKYSDNLGIKYIKKPINRSHHNKNSKKVYEYDGQFTLIKIWNSPSELCKTKNIKRISFNKFGLVERPNIVYSLNKL